MVINVIMSELVKPSEATPQTPLWLSNLDLGARNSYTPMIYLFRNRNDDSQGFFSPDILRAALARALVPFYPLAGQLSMALDGRVEIDCNAHGAVFIVTRSDAVVLDDLEGFTPSKEMCDMFVPPYEKEAGTGSPLLLLQLTFLRCGSVVLGTAMHHYALDGRSSFHFIETWASMARGVAGDNVPPPFLDRSSLRARSPPIVLFDHNHEYCRHKAGLSITNRPSELTGAILHVTNAQVSVLRARTGESMFRTLAAHIWRCTCMARSLDPGVESRLYTMVDMRARLSPPLPDTYLGNVSVRTSVPAKVGDLLTDPLNFGAKRVRMATGHGDEYVRSLVDYLETSDLQSKPGRELPDTDLRVISWMGMASHDADFGWGEPALVAPVVMSYTWFIYSIGNSGDVAVAVAMKPDHLERFKELFFNENEMTW